ncbi:hypothetical protein EUGRSUZ_K00356 [Eucalyptus grandis]|uniref:Uncharacterized protein n=2 Tax=Eucalyptus grandis TaxID=71139 RepID=A0A058ZYT8_EUCGR|nr:hypothetical protein EUGRSUZ_K00356 [Eucalyptus grandis]
MRMQPEQCCANCLPCHCVLKGSKYLAEHLESHVEFLRSFAGLDDQEIFRIILVFPNIVSVSKFFKECGLSSDEIFKFLTKAPLFWVYLLKETLLISWVFFVKLGYKQRTKQFAVAIGAVTRTSCENMQKVIMLFLSSRFSCKDVLLMSKKHPQIFQYNPDSLEEKVEYLVGEMGCDLDELLDFPAFLGTNSIIELSIGHFDHQQNRGSIYPQEICKECGLNSSKNFKFLTKAPLFLGLSFEGNIVHKLRFMVKIGYKYRMKEFAVAIGAVTRTSCKNMQKLIELFLSYRFSCEDVLLMSKKHPQILPYNADSLEEKVEYLVGEMGRDLDKLLDFPAFLCYKLDSRIKHRYEVKKKIIDEGMLLNKLLSVSSKRFAKRKPEKLANKA